MKRRRNKSRIKYTYWQELTDQNKTFPKVLEGTSEYTKPILKNIEETVTSNRDDLLRIEEDFYGDIHRSRHDENVQKMEGIDNPGKRDTNKRLEDIPNIIIQKNKKMK